MRLSRALSDLVKYTKSVRVHDIETQGKHLSPETEHLHWNLFTFITHTSSNHLILRMHASFFFLFLFFFICQAFTNSWQVSSLNESVMNQILQLRPGALVHFNQRQLLRVYPSNYRVDSSNFNPQPYWNAGCHMGTMLAETEILPNLRWSVYCSSLTLYIFSYVILVAMNYQTEGRMLELNRAKFSSNGNCGYILKPKCMCKGMDVQIV